MEIKYMFLMSCYMVSSTNTVAYLSMLSRPVMEFQNTARGHWNLYLLPVSEYFMHTVCLSFFGTTITTFNFRCRIAGAKIFQFME